MFLVESKLNGAVSSCRNHWWSNTAPSGDACQIDLVWEWEGERKDYICEMRSSKYEFTIDKAYEKELGNMIGTFLNSKQHMNTQSFQLVMVLSNDIILNVHATDITQQVSLNDLL